MVLGAGPAGAAAVLGLRRLSWTASLLLLPYLGWVTLASGLNLATVQLNGPFQTALR